jgi:hypothetical protein
MIVRQQLATSGVAFAVSAVFAFLGLAFAANVLNAEQSANDRTEPPKRENLPTSESVVPLDRVAVPMSWRDSRNCGPISLYALATLCDHATTLDAVMGHAPPGPDGVDLASLQLAASQIGFQTKTIQFRDVAFLQRLESPFIAHLSSSQLGHFVVVLHISDSQVLLGDGITAKMRRQSVSDFLRESSGFALIPTSAIWRERGIRVLYSTTVLLVFLVLAELAMAVRRRRSA